MNDAQKQILRKMMDKDVIGKRHTLEDTLKHCLQRKDRGKFNNAIKDLCRQGYITKHRTEHGMSYTISPCKVPEIKKLLEL